MRFDRKFYMGAMVILAVFLFATNVHAAKLIMSAGDGGTIATDPAFDASGELQVARGDTVVFTLTPDPNFHVAYFNRSDGNSKKDISVLDTFPELCPEDPDTGVVTCTLTDFTNNFWFDVTFSAIPVIASFVTDQPSGSEAGISVQFTDTSEHIDSDANQNIWSWNFGDGTTSSVQNPVHTFAVGTHNVTLTVTNEKTETTDSYTLSYTAIQPTITYLTNAGANGSISPVGPHTVPEGTATTFTITPDEFYQVASVQAIDENGTVVYDYGPETSVLFDGLTDVNDYTIVASFEPIQTGMVKLEGLSKQYSTLQVAYDAAVIDEGLSEATFRIHGGEALPQNLVFNLDLIVTLLGGYDDTFENLDPANPYTIIDGTITIRAGTVTISNLIIGPST